MKLLATAATAALFCSFTVTSAMACAAHKTHSASLPNYVASLESKLIVKDQAAENMSVPTQNADSAETIEMEARIVPTSGKTDTPSQ
jgi:hypothetical protein